MFAFCMVFGFFCVFGRKKLNKKKLQQKKNRQKFKTTKKKLNALST